MTIAQPVVIWGMGGAGKTTAARALCDHPRIRASFPDGILWANAALGPEYSRIQLQQWVNALTGRSGPSTSTLDELKVQLSNLLETRSCLLIIDDAKDVEHLSPYFIRADRCRALVTTRNSAIAWETGAIVQKVPSFLEAEALELLSAWAERSDENDYTLRAICNRVAYHPLAVKLAGGRIRRLDASLWLQGFEELGDLDANFSTAQPHHSVVACLGLSLQTLDDSLRSLYLSLAVFQEAHAIPSHTIARLWRGVGNITDRRARRALDELADMALLDVSGKDRDIVTFHPLVHRWLIEISEKSALVDTHRALLDSYHAPNSVLSVYPAENDGYIYDHLCWHLKGAIRNNSILGLFRSESWMRARVTDSGYVYDQYLNDLCAGRTIAIANTRRSLSDRAANNVSIADTIRLLMIQTKISGLATRHIPEIVGQAVQLGGWTFDRALSTAEKIRDSTRRSRIFRTLLELGIATGDTLSHIEASAIEATWAIHSDGERGEAFARLVPLLSDDWKSKAIDDGWDSTVRGLDNEVDPWPALRAINHLGPVVAPERREDVVDRTMQDCLYWADDAEAALSWLLPVASTRSIMKIVENLTDDPVRLAMLLSQAVTYLPSNELGQSMRKCIASGAAEYLDPDFFAQCAYQLAENDWPLALSIVRLLGDEDAQAEALAYLVGVVEGHYLVEGFSHVLELSDAGKRAEVLAVGLPKLSPEQGARFSKQDLLLAEEIRQASERTLYFPLSAEKKKKQLDAAVSEALAITVENQREQKLAEIASSLDRDALEKCLIHAIEGEPDYSEISHAIAAIATLGSRSIADARSEIGHMALDVAEQCPGRGMNLMGLVSRIVPDLDASTFDRCLQIARSVTPENHQYDVLGAVAIRMDGSDRQQLLGEWLQSIVETPADGFRATGRAEAFAKYAGYLPDEHRWEMTDRMLADAVSYMRPDILQHIAAFLRPARALEEFARIGDRDAERSLVAIVGLSEAVPQSARHDAIDRALGLIRRLSNRDVAWSTISSLSTAPPIVTELARYASNLESPYFRSQALTCIARSPFLQDRDSFVEIALDAIELEDDWQSREDQVVRIAPLLPDALASRAIAIATEAVPTHFQVRALAALSQRYGQDALDRRALQVFLDTLEIISQWTHEHVLIFGGIEQVARIPSLLPVECAEIARAIFYPCYKWRWI